MISSILGFFSPKENTNNRLISKSLQDASLVHHALMFNTHLESIIKDKNPSNPGVRDQIDSLVTSYTRNKSASEIQALGLLILTSNFPEQAFPDQNSSVTFQYGLRSNFRIDSATYKQHEIAAMTEGKKHHD